MAKAAILVPDLSLCETARALVAGYPYIEPVCVEHVQTAQVAGRARLLEQNGCELIVARGVQARLIMDAVRLPVVQLRVTAQELGSVMLDLRRALGLERPRIALIGFANMFCDVSQFNELFQIDLLPLMAADNDGLAPLVEQAMAQGCRAVVGGDLVCRQARALGLPCRFIPAGAESMHNALQMASSLCYAIDLEKRNSAEMDTMLRYTFNGIMQVDRDGVVRRVNQTGYALLGATPADAIGQPVAAVLPRMDPRLLEKALADGEETYALAVDLRQTAMIVNIAPIRLQGRIDGAILTFQEGRRIHEMDSEMRRELYQRGFIARYTFDRLFPPQQQDDPMLCLARRIAKYPAPVLITGESGTGKWMVAQCLHNESLCKGNAFVPVDCSAWLPETLDNMLFGNHTTRKDTPACMAELARDGTLYLSHVECLPFETQYKLLSLINGRFLHNGVHRPIGMEVRVIASTSADLAALAGQGAFRRDLYYALGVLTLPLEPLRRQRQNIPFWVDHFLEQWQQRYKRYIHLTAGARQFLAAYDWPGNLEQVSRSCQRIVLLAEKRTVDEVFLRRQLEQAAPAPQAAPLPAPPAGDPKAERLAALLRKHGGNREKVAAEMGISKTTLWRYIKKYGIEPDFRY